LVRAPPRQPIGANLAVAYGGYRPQAQDFNEHVRPLWEMKTDRRTAADRSPSWIYLLASSTGAGSGPGPMASHTYCRK